MCVPLGKGGLGMWGWECGELARWMVGLGGGGFRRFAVERERDGLGRVLWRECGF